MSEPFIAGVRHHSPACARLVQRSIRRIRPAVVLVEGPADMNGRLDELALEHRPPIAICSYYQVRDRAFASFAPLCDYSPVYVAVREGLALGADVRFIDLPAWSVPFHGVVNRYSDREQASARYVQRLSAHLGIEGLDPLWDHLFEQPIDVDTLDARLDAYFEALRSTNSDAALEQRDVPREAFMAQHVAHAMVTAPGPVLVVCGGYHAPFLARAWRDAPTERPRTPSPPTGTRHGSYLVPYSFHRLDSFTGCEAGMPSPAYYQAVWEVGPASAGERMLEAAVTRLRSARHPVSTADLIAVETMTRALMRLRGHDAIARTDLLDGLATALLKEVQDGPLPWIRRGPIRPGTDPLLVEVLDTLRGDREGSLAPRTPRPPLSADVRRELERLDLTPAVPARTVTLELIDRRDRERSRALHRVRILQIPGFARIRGPRRPTDSETTETWTLERVLDAEARWVEAAAWGATLESAAGARLEEQLHRVRGDLGLLAHLLGEVLFVGLSTLADRVLADLAQQVNLEPRLDRLGRALSFLLALFRHDALYGAAQSAELGVLIAAMVRRGCWLFEGMGGPDATARPEELRALVAIRDAMKYATGLDLDHDAVRCVMERRALAPDAPPAHRGAALGYLWSMDALGGEGEARERAVRALRSAAQPNRIGELLAGLFALAREEVARAGVVLEALDGILAGQTWEEFLIALPALRLAFGWFPPLERDAIARQVLAIHGRRTEASSRLRRLEVDAATVARGVELERCVSERRTRFGLAPEVGR